MYKEGHIYCRAQPVHFVHRQFLLNFSFCLNTWKEMQKQDFRWSEELRCGSFFSPECLVCLFPNSSCKISILSPFFFPFRAFIFVECFLLCYVILNGDLLNLSYSEYNFISLFSKCGAGYLVKCLAEKL